MNQARAKELLGKAISPSALTPVGRYTKPASWGVYKIGSEEGSATTLYRIGNHPVRLVELRREFQTVEIAALFTARALAEELSKLLNNGHLAHNA